MAQSAHSPRESDGRFRRTGLYRLHATLAPAATKGGLASEIPDGEGRLVGPVEHREKWACSPYARAIRIELG
jgi:hypothetical protein